VNKHPIGETLPNLVNLVKCDIQLCFRRQSDTK
jgi:hypothetical protein